MLYNLEINMDINDELKRLNSNGIEDNYKGFIAEIIADCAGNASDVLQKTKDVLKKIIDCELSFDDPIDDWRVILPEWFINACSSEITKNEAEEILRTPQGYELLANRWTISGFIYWFRPEIRSWYWWDGIIKDQNILLIKVLVDGDPFAWGALEFLLKSAGANSVEEL